MRRQRHRCGRVLVVGTLLALTVPFAFGFGRDPSPAKDTEEQLQPYLKVLRESGQDPVHFVVDKLATHDLIIFDDSSHDALEPWESTSN